MAARATALLGGGETLLLADLIFAECIYVLESFYEVPRARVALLMRSALALDGMEAVSPGLLVRALEVYELDRLDFAEAYLVAQAESTGVGEVISFDRTIDRVTGVRRREP
jgi:predicted nucleic-acid-binding protein